MERMQFNKLIAEVERRPILWDVNHPKYKNTSCTTIEWEAVASVLNCEVAYATSKWKNIRDIFVKKYRKDKDCLRSGMSASDIYVIRWPYFNQLMFLKDTVEARRTTSNYSVCRPSQVEEGMAADVPMPLPISVEEPVLEPIVLEVLEEPVPSPVPEAAAWEADSLITPSQLPASSQVNFSSSPLHDNNRHKKTPERKRSAESLKTAEDFSKIYTELSKPPDENFALSLVAHLKDVPKKYKVECQIDILKTIKSYIDKCDD